MSESTEAVSYEVTNFQEDVVAASHHSPVLVDFWAPWCGPCRVLGPVLEKLARENGGAWKLAKVNSDEHPELSMEYGIRGIPAVKLFADGKVVDEFVGALPEYAVKQWLEKALPGENQHRVEQAQTALSEGNADEAETLLQQVLAEEPNHAAAQVLMAQILAFKDPEQAEALVAGAAFAGPAFLQIGEAVQTVARLRRLKDHPDQLPGEPGREAYLAGLEALAKRDFGGALEKFIEVIQQNRYYDDDGARKAGIALFTLLGEKHPVTRAYRRTFDMWLY